MAEINFTKYVLSERVFMIRWTNIGPGDQGAPFDAGAAQALSSQCLMRLDGSVKVELYASNELEAPRNAVAVCPLAERGNASLASIPIQARWYYPRARSGLNSGSVDVIMRFQIV